MEPLGNGIEVETHLQIEDVDIKDIRWAQMFPRLSDKIGDTYVALSTPTARGWHTMISLGKYIVAFGGFRYRKRLVPQPFTSATKHNEVEYLNDIFVYDTENLSWHNPIPEDPCPIGRYGHVAAPLDSNRMVREEYFVLSSYADSRILPPNSVSCTRTRTPIHR